MPTSPRELITLADVVDHYADVRPEATALVSDSLELTWSDLRTRTRRLASRLLGLRVSPGDRVAVVSNNRPEIIEVQLACARIGAIFTPLNTRLAMPELSRLMDLVQPSVLLHDQAHDAQARRLSPGLRRIDFDGDSSFGYSSLVALPTRFDGLDVIEPDTDAMMIFTSGTTGTPLGAVLTHAQIAANHRQFLETLPIDRDTVNYAVAPLFHVAGLNTITGPTLVAGGTSVFAERFDSDVALGDFNRFGVTATFMVPTMWRDIVQNPAFEQGAAEGLEFGLVGGASCPASVERALNRGGVPLYEGYGMSEAGPMVTLRAPGTSTSAPQSVGIPGPEVELRVVDEDRIVLTVGQIGELQVRAPNVMRGYWNEPAATNAVLQDGWLSTGDVGYLADGQFNLLDRVDDMINSGAEKVYPSEIERLLMAHAAVDEVAIIGTPHPRWGQAVTAVVVPSEDAEPDLQSLRDHLSEDLASYKLPRRLELVASLPRNGAGKILRREVAARLCSDTSVAI